MSIDEPPEITPTNQFLAPEHVLLEMAEVGAGDRGTPAGVRVLDAASRDVEPVTVTRSTW